MKNISVAQFEAIVTQRVLYACMSLSAARNGFALSDLISKALPAGNHVLYDFGLGDECQCKLRGMRIFLMHKRNKRVVAEIVLSGDKADNGLYRRPKAYLLGRRGFVKEQRLSDLINAVGKLNNYIRRKNA